MAPHHEVQTTLSFLLLQVSAFLGCWEGSLISALRRRPATSGDGEVRELI
jgi:hypothetical protein